MLSSTYYVIANDYLLCPIDNHLGMFGICEWVPFNFVKKASTHVWGVDKLFELRSINIVATGLHSQQIPSIQD